MKARTILGDTIDALIIPLLILFLLSVTEKSHREEDRMVREHKQEVDELHKDLQEKDEKMEQLIDDYEEQLAVSAERCSFIFEEHDLNPMLVHVFMKYSNLCVE